jgi:threonine synthase
MAILRCPSCGAEPPGAPPDFACPCGELLDVEHAFRPVQRALFDGRLGSREAPLDSGVWRFRELVYHRFPSEAVVSLREGNTPLLRAREVARWAGIDDLRLKHEGLNPTGSFKDRGMTVAVSRAAASGARVLACASTGNTAASLAAYAAAAGLRAVVVAPEAGTALGKLSQALAYGARTLLVRGDFDQALRLVLELARAGEVELLNSVNPFRIEGQKSIVLEILQELLWQPPDWIVFPAGNLGNCAAFGKALREARALGLIERTPRLAAVQASGAAPFAAAFRTGFQRLVPVRAETVASAIRIGDPASWRRAARSIRETNGLVIEVDDQAILDAKAAVDSAGIGAEPASCAAVAGAKKLALRGEIDAGERVVCVLTGHLLKDPETTLAYHQGRLAGIRAARANPPRVIEPKLDELRAALQPD